MFDLEKKVKSRKFKKSDKEKKYKLIFKLFGRNENEIKAS